MVKCKSQSKVSFQNCAEVDYPCPWWFMVSFDAHVGVPFNLYTQANYEGPIWPASLSSTQLLLSKEGFVWKLPSLIPQLPKPWGQFAKTVNKGKVRSCWCICSLFFHQGSTVFQKSIMFLSERGKERDRYSNLGPVQTHILLFLCLLNIFNKL